MCFGWSYGLKGIIFIQRFIVLFLSASGSWISLVSGAPVLLRRVASVRYYISRRFIYYSDEIF